LQVGFLRAGGAAAEGGAEDGDGCRRRPLLDDLHFVVLEKDIGLGEFRG
jgi:hypothetical protein